jgi:hypothetical protein
MIALYVDDITAAWLASFKARLGARFKVKDLGSLSQLLGMHITRDRSARTISLDQSKHLRDNFAKYGTTDSKPSSLPMYPGFLAGLAHMTSPPLTGWPRTSTQASWAASYTRPFARHALPTLVGQMTTAPASLVRAISSFSDAGP